MVEHRNGHINIEPIQTPSQNINSHPLRSALLEHERLYKKSSRAVIFGGGLSTVTMALTGVEITINEPIYAAIFGTFSVINLGLTVQTFRIMRKNQEMIARIKHSLQERE